MSKVLLLANHIIGIPSPRRLCDSRRLFRPIRAVDFLASKQMRDKTGESLTLARESEYCQLANAKKLIVSSLYLYCPNGSTVLGGELNTT